MKEIVINIQTVSIILFIGAFLFTYVVIPKIIKVANLKSLMDSPNQRSSHIKITPTLGGVAFFFTILVCLFFLKPWDTELTVYHLIPGLTILFITGLKDDLFELAPLTKLIAQIASVSFVLSSDFMVVDSLNGFFGITEIYSFIAYPINAFIMITLINSFNLIDGIDGLAAVTGIIISFIYGIIFYYLGLFFFSLLCVVTIATLLAFLRFNISDSKKIFMGDTGSMLIGFLISVFTIRFLSMDASMLETLPLQLENIPFIVASILIVPLFDTARVFIIRILKSKSPFSPDRSHIHHILIDFGLSHRRASFVIGLSNLMFVIFFALLGGSGDNIMMISLFGVILFTLVLLFFSLDISFSNLKNKVRARKIIIFIKKWFSKKKE